MFFEQHTTTRLCREIEMGRIRCEEIIDHTGRGIVETAKLINDLLDDRCTLRTVCERLEVNYKEHRGSLRNFIDKYCNRRKPEPVGDDELKFIVERLKRPGTGHVLMEGMVVGLIREGGHTVSRKRLRQCIYEGDADGVRLRRQRRLRRRKYYSKGPGWAWHLDGYHKLAFSVGFGIVIHGCIDGFSRQIVFCRASDNNYKETVKKLFVRAIQEKGVPRRVCLDRGGENNDVAEIMYRLFGGEDWRVKWVSSVRNQRIERWWKDVWPNVAAEFRFLFDFFIEECDFDEDNLIHRFCLHHTFLDCINEKVDVFVRGWNIHGMRKGRLPPDDEDDGDDDTRFQQYSPDMLANLNKERAHYRSLETFPIQLRDELLGPLDNVPETRQVVIESSINPFTRRNDDFPDLFPGGREDLYEILLDTPHCKASIFDSEEEKIQAFINCLDVVQILLQHMRDDI